MIAAEQNIIPADISFCNSKTVPLCIKNQSMGSVTVKRGSDNKVYITYNLTGNYFFAALSLFTGVTTAIPMIQTEPNVCTFPYKKVFTAPFTVQQYTYVLNNQPQSFTVAAYAAIVKKQGNSFKPVEDAWADGCSGNKIYTGKNNITGGDKENDDKDDEQGNHDGDHEHQDNDHSQSNGGCSSSHNMVDCKGGAGATLFTYSGGNCFVAPSAAAVVTEPDICSFTSDCFFGIHPYHKVVTAWITPTVTVGGIAYTEEEGRAIAVLPENPAILSNACNSKDAYLAVATLKLSNTGYTLSPTIGPAVATIEAWLSTVGKISATNLPTGNATIKNATTVLNNFIKAHNCPYRIE